VRFAALRDAELASWIDEQVTFPSSMVDRITPETSPEARDRIEDDFGVPDRWPVVTEPFRQWVVEDGFCAGRPPLDRVGVRFVDDVAPVLDEDGLAAALATCRPATEALVA